MKQEFNESEAKQRVLEAFMEKPTTYKIEVIDDSVLPKEKQKEEYIAFTIKPPTPGVLGLAGLEFQKVPESILNPDTKVTIQEAIPYIPNMIRAICILAHGKQTPYPDWWEKFLTYNLKPKEIFGILQEGLAKTDFFLTSFQIANQNPMMMNKVMKKNTSDSTPSNS